MIEYSNLFVVLMGMGVVFFGLICIILLTTVMGMIMTRKEINLAKRAVLENASKDFIKSNSQISKNTLAAILAAVNQSVGSPYNVVDIQKMRM